MPAENEVSTGLDVASVDVSHNQKRMENIAVEKIIPNKVSLRGPQTEDPKFRELLHSIAQHGVQKPILLNDNGDGTFTLIDGLQRFTAVSTLHNEMPENSAFNTVPAVITKVSTDDELTLQIILNNQSIKTKPVEYSKAIQRLMASNNYTLDELASRLSMSIPSVNNVLRLNDLHPEIANLVNDGKIKVTNAYVLAKLPQEDQQHYIEEAMTLSPTDFAPKIDSRLKELRAAKTNAPEPTGPEPKLRKLVDLRARHEELSTLLKAEPDDNVLAARVAELAYILQIDPDSVQSWKAERDRKEKERQLNTVKKAEERAAEAAKLAEETRRKISNT